MGAGHGISFRALAILVFSAIMFSTQWLCRLKSSRSSRVGFSGLAPLRWRLESRRHCPWGLPSSTRLFPMEASPGGPLSSWQFGGGPHWRPVWCSRPVGRRSSRPAIRAVRSPGVRSSNRTLRSAQARPRPAVCMRQRSPAQGSIRSGCSLFARRSRLCRGLLCGWLNRRPVPWWGSIWWGCWAPRRACLSPAGLGWCDDSPRPLGRARPSWC